MHLLLAGGDSLWTAPLTLVHSDGQDRAGHRTLQFILAPISLWLLFVQGLSFAPQGAVILWDAIMGGQGTR